MVVLGFTLTPHPAPRNWTTTPMLEDRLRLGMSLFEKNISTNIVLSGGWGTRKSQALAMERFLIDQRPPPLPTPWQLILEGNSNTTYQNALFTAEIIRERGYRSLAVVTSSFHQFRSRLTFCSVFKRLGMNNVQVRTVKSRRETAECFFFFFFFFMVAQVWFFVSAGADYHCENGYR
jgi:hypothetical protein